LVIDDQVVTVSAARRRPDPAIRTLTFASLFEMLLSVASFDDGGVAVCEDVLS
jgi:hypothetical protein